MTWTKINDTSSNGSFHAPFLAIAMTEQAHHCSSGLTKTLTCVQLSNTYRSATLTIATFPTAAACRGFDASACTPTPRDLLSSHWQLRLHCKWKVASPLYIDVHLVAHGLVPLTLQIRRQQSARTVIRQAEVQRVSGTCPSDPLCKSQWNCLWFTS